MIWKAGSSSSSIRPDLVQYVTCLDTVVSRGGLTLSSHSQGWISPGLRGPFPQALTFLGKPWFITWRLRYSFSGECWRGPGHFWACREGLGHGPAIRPTLKRPCATLACFVERATNIVDLISWLIFDWS